MQSSQEFPIAVEKKFSRGEVIIHKGEICDDIYIVKDGMAEIVETTPAGREVLIGIADKGQVFGETGFILEQPSNITVRALEDVVVDVFDTRSFSRLYESDLGAYMRPIMQKIAERLRVADLRLAELEAREAGYSSENQVEESTEAGNWNQVESGDTRVLMIANTPEAINAMGGLKSIEITTFPFDVGRFSRRRSDDMFHLNNFYMNDFPPFAISRSHFSIIKKGGSFFFRDRGSSLGSQVNNVRVGGGRFNTRKIKLHNGENIIVLGGEAKNLIFTVGIV